MKKKALLAASLLSLVCAASSFAAFGWLYEGDTPAAGAAQAITVTAGLPEAKFKVSSNVVMGYAAHASGAAYSIGSYHVSGTFTYATASTETGIYRIENPTGNATQANVTKGPDAPSDATDSAGTVSAFWVANSWTLSK